MATKHMNDFDMEISIIAYFIEQMKLLIDQFHVS